MWLKSLLTNVKYISIHIVIFVSKKNIGIRLYFLSVYIIFLIFHIAKNAVIATKRKLCIDNYVKDISKKSP